MLALTRSQPAPVQNEEAPIRHDLVRRIRAQIEAGTYDSGAKIEAAGDRLLDLLV